MAQLKGDALTNRYRINGTLTTVSPLHVGTGEAVELSVTDSERARYMEEVGKIPSVSTILTDHRGKPLIPGSALRGVMRHWLLTVLQGVGPAWAAVRDYGADGFFDLPQDEQIRRAREEFSAVELLFFGTPLNVGKVEVWDAVCVTGNLQTADRLLGWKADRLTYVDTSVAIDPATGTAVSGLLYKTEIVPPAVALSYARRPEPV